MNFIPDSGHWRIDCLGPLSYMNGPELVSQPTISVALSQATKAPNKQTAAGANFTLTRNQRNGSVPIAMLPVLEVGDFWSKNRPTLYPDYEKFSVSLAGEHVQHATTVYLGDVAPWSKRTPPDEKPEFLLPYNQHPYHKSFTRGFAELIRTSDDIQLLIPHWEIIRFYFGSSTQLIESLFDVRATLNDLFDEEKSVAEANRHAHIHLRANLPYASAGDVARICFCPRARHAVTALRNSLIAQSANGTPVYPKTKLPISGPTVLDMVGKRISYQNGTQGFICYKLTACHASFPFSSLSYFKDMPGDENPYPDRDSLEPMNVKKRNDKDGPRQPRIGQHDANSGCGTRIYQMNTSSRFPYLDQIPKEKQRRDPYTHYSEPDYLPQPHVDSEDGVGSGGREPKKSAKLERKEHALNTCSTLSINFKYFFEALDVLISNKKAHSVEFITPTPDSNDLRCTILPIAHTKKGRVSMLSYVDYVKGYVHTAKFRRRAIVAKIGHIKGITYLLEAEARVYKGLQLDTFPTFLMKALDAGELTEREIQDTLQAFSTNEWSWGIPTNLPHARGEVIRHPQKKPDDTPDTYVNRLYERFSLALEKA